MEASQRQWAAIEAVSGIAADEPHRLGAVVACPARRALRCADVLRRLWIFRRAHRVSRAGARCGSSRRCRQVVRMRTGFIAHLRAPLRPEGSLALFVASLVTTTAPSDARCARLAFTVGLSESLCREARRRRRASRVPFLSVHTCCALYPAETYAPCTSGLRHRRRGLHRHTIGSALGLVTLSRLQVHLMLRPPRRLPR